MRKIMTRTGTVAVAAVAVTGVGVAFAAWTSTGAGVGSAAAGSAVDLSVAQTAVAGLVPNTTKDLNITVSNPNPYAVDLSALSAVVTVTKTGGAGTCTPSDISYTAPDLAANVPAASATAAGTQSYTGTVSMGTNASNDCQGATFTLTYTSTGTSTASAPVS